MKAKVCVEGSRRLRSWVEEHDLPINSCGKVIVPQRTELDSQLDVLAERGRANGAKVEFLDAMQLREIIPEARTSSGRALWSPSTAVVKPTTVIHRLRQHLVDLGVKFIQGKYFSKVFPDQRRLILSDHSCLNYSHLFNCTGLQADRVAQSFGVGEGYTILPFKGHYLQLKECCPFQPRTNLYPVPDLSLPFLGVHFTPSVDPTPRVFIGPTATPAFGRENYKGFADIEPGMALGNLQIILQQYLSNRGGFRRYVHQQALLSLQPLLIHAARELIPAIKPEHFEPSFKVGIRPQLFNQKNQRLEDDFLCFPGPFSTHVLNAISPAFTASFALADLIIDEATSALNL